MAKQKSGAATAAGGRGVIANNFVFTRYKRTQGRVTRQLTAAAVSLIVLFGTYTLYYKLLSESQGAARMALGVSLGITFLGLWTTYRIIHWPRFADFLISVEAEMDKVTWSDWGELKRATVVVLVTMVILTAVLFLFDVFWQRVFTSTGVLF
ncbi:MAG: preprotein translocase subunit SecE [Planctomycetaceae bacterium]|jgi:preprotein translocase subunit SecE|nr:preprotein translocase subunit SecE [Planctomycetaceae bacterium]